MNQLVVREVEWDKEVNQHQEGTQRYSFLVNECILSNAALLETLWTLKEMIFAASNCL